MKQLKFLVILMLATLVGKAQAPSNYTNINGRYRWIAGMFDSTFHIPKGTTPSLRTGGSTNSGGLFYNTSDSSVYTYTGTQWIKLRGSLNPSDTTNKYVTQVYKKNGSDSVFYVKGGTHTWAFNDSTGSAGGGGGGKIYYFNGSVNMGTFGGLTMYELGDTANTGAAANFNRATTGPIANFITDPNKPGLLQIPAGVWTIDAWLSETGGGANHAEIWAVLEKWDGATITTIATSPIEQITEGSTPNLYTWSITVPTTALAVTDRIIIQFYITNTNGKTVTLYTQNGYVGEVHTTFTTGIGALNGLTAPAQYLVTGTSGTDFNISSVTATHTFNLPTASATNRGALSTSDWTTFNNKIGGSGTTNYISKFTGSNTIGNSAMRDDGTNVGIGITPSGSILNQLQVQYAVLMGNSSDATANYLGSNFYLGAGADWKYIANNQASQLAQTSGQFYWNTASSGTAGNNITWNTRMQLTNSGLLGIGTGFIDSNLTVGLGTHLKRGVRMSALPTGVGTKALRIDATGNVSVADTLTNGVSGSLTTDFIPKATGTSTLGNSPLSVGAGVVGLGLGVVPPNAWTNYWALQLANGVALGSYNFSNIPIGWLGTNAYHDGMGDIRVSNGAANKYLQDRGNHKWFVAGSGTAGSYISFTQAMTLDSSNRLSIGTTTMDSMFKVAQGAYFQRGVRMSGLPTGAGTKAVRIDANGTLSTADTLANGISGTGTTNYIPKFTSSSAIGNSQVFDNGTNVGIGTASPTNKLEVSGGITITEDVNAVSTFGRYSAGYTWSIFRPSVNSNGFELRDNGGNALYQLDQTTGSQKHLWYTSGSERMRLDASGNLGLGTSSPGASLHVAGSISASPTGSGFMAGLQGNYAVVHLNGSDGGLIDFSVSGTDTKGRIIYTNSTDAMGFGTSNGVTRMTLDASGNLGLGVTPSAWVTPFGTKAIQFAASGSIYGLDISSSDRRAGLMNNAFINSSGNYVYINTGHSTQYEQNAGTHKWLTAPSGTAGNAITFTQAMTLVGTSDVKLSIGTTANDGNANYGNITLNGLSGSLIDVRQNGTLYGRVRAQANEFALLSQGASSVLVLGTDNTERARFNTSGELLINTTTDVGDYKLQVSGNVYASGSGTFGSAIIGGTTPLYLNFNAQASSTNRVGIFYRGTQGADASMITAFGTPYLSIGGQENLVNSIQTIGFGFTNGTSYTQPAEIGFQTTSLSGYTLGDLVFATRSVTTNTVPTERLRITSAGLVGIGTTSPTSGLEIITNGSTTNSLRIGTNVAYNTSPEVAIVSRYKYNSAGDYAVGSVINTAKDNTTDGSQSGNLQFWTNNAGSFAERMRITSGGNVLVGTTTDAGYKLDVNGTGRFSGQLTVLASSSSTAGLVVRGGSSIGTPATASGQILIGQTTTYRGSIAYDDNTGYMYIDNLYDNANSNIYIRTKTSGTPVNALTIVGSGAATFSSSVTAQQGLSVSGNGALTNSANKFILDFYNGNSRLYSLGTNTSTKGGYEFHTNSSDGSLDVVALSIASTGAATFSSSITTGAPSGGTAGAWKLGSRVASAGVTFNDQQYIQLDIGGTLYYLATVDLPMPEAYPQATSGPSNNYKITPVQVKTTKDVEIEKLRKELDELKQIIKNLNK